MLADAATPGKSVRNYDDFHRVSHKQKTLRIVRQARFGILRLSDEDS
jgi:hypothetical protein